MESIIVGMITQVPFICCFYGGRFVIVMRYKMKHEFVMVNTKLILQRQIEYCHESIISELLRD
jgi:hypothetical protein